MIILVRSVSRHPKLIDIKSEEENDQNATPTTNQDFQNHSTVNKWLPEELRKNFTSLPSN